MKKKIVWPTIRMMSVAEFAKYKGIKPATLYSWIARNQAEKNGFTVHKFGNLTLLQEIEKQPA